MQCKKNYKKITKLKNHKKTAKKRHKKKVSLITITIEKKHIIFKKVQMSKNDRNCQENAKSKKHYAKTSP